MMTIKILKIFLLKEEVSKLLKVFLIIFLINEACYVKSLIMEPVYKLFEAYLEEFLESLI